MTYPYFGISNLWNYGYNNLIRPRLQGCFTGQRIFIIDVEGYAYPQGDQAIYKGRKVMTKLTPKEKEIAESVERGEWKSVKAA